MSFYSSARVSSTSLYGNLWGRGYETFSYLTRKIISVKGTDATKFLQGLVSCDLLAEPMNPSSPCYRSIESISKTETMFPKRVPILRPACFLDQKGRIITDALLWQLNQQGHETELEYLIDVSSETSDLLLDHLKTHKLYRVKVTVSDKTTECGINCIYGTLNTEGTPPGYLAALDPRHASLGMRVLSFPPLGAFSNLIHKLFPTSTGTYNVIRRLAGVAEGSELSGKTALECNQDFLGAVSFKKGCYLGQELTARSQHIGTIRKRIMPIFLIDLKTEVPQPWIISHLVQEKGANNFSKLKGLLTTTPHGETDALTTPEQLPVLSIPEAGAIAGKLYESFSSSSISGGMGPVKSRKETCGFLPDVEEAAVKGALIIDQNDGKSIGQVISSPAPGTSVILAQMRLDRVGLHDNDIEDGEKWSRMNRIIIGDSKKEFRYLPYIPVWWPSINRKTGKMELVS